MKYRVTWETRKRHGRIRYYAKFRSYVEGKEEEDTRKGSSVDVKVGVPNPTELLALARMLGCRVSGEKQWITTDDEQAYFRLIVYAVVRQTLRKPEKIDELRRLVLDEGFSTDAWWWANTFMNKYKTEGSRRGVGIKCLYRPAKGFKYVYNLV